MALTKDDIRLAAGRLHQAEKTRQQIRQLSLEFPGITIADAYAIQHAWIELKVAEVRVVKGHKIGLTSKAMQSALRIDEPRPIETPKGDTIQADYGPYGSVSCYFA